MIELPVELKEKIIKAAEYMEDGDPLKDVVDDYDIMEAIDYLAIAIMAEEKQQ